MIVDTTSVESLFVGVASFSLVMLLAAIFLLPVVFVRIPADYFVRQEGKSPWSNRHPVLQFALWIARNLLGGSLIVLGVLMLVLPGQGLLTMAAGLLIASFPGKRRLEMAILSRPWIRSSVNLLRNRVGKEPLRFPES